MSILDRFTGRRPAVSDQTTTLAADPPPAPPETGNAIGEYGGPTTGAYVQRSWTRYAHLLNKSKLDAAIINAMREHPQVTACLAAQTLPLLRAEWSIECEDEAIREETTRRYGELHARVMRSFGRALWAGYSPNVLVWDVDPADGALVVSGLRDLDPLTCKPRTADNGDYVGFTQFPPSGEQPIDVDPLESLWGVEGLESGNLYGRSLLTAARVPWQDQQTVGLFHLRYLERFGEPVVIMRAPSGTVDRNETERVNALAWNAAHPDDQREVPPVEWVSKLDQALALGENLRHHSVLALPSEAQIASDGKSVAALAQWSAEYLSAGTADGTAFADKIAYLDRAIARAMLVPALLLEGGDTVGSNALGQAHRDTFTANVEARLDDYAAQITQHLIDRLVTFNYGESAPRARLVFSPMTDETAEQLWSLFGSLIDGKAIAVDGPAIANRLGVPVLVADDPEVDPVAASPFSSVGLPALVQAGIITAQEAHDLLGLEGLAPEPSVVDAAFAAARAGNGNLARVILGFDPTERDVARRTPAVAAEPSPVAFLAAAPGDVTGMPEWKQPAAYDPEPFRRDLTPREARVGFRQIENELNAAEARTIDELVAILEASQERVSRQVAGIMRKGGSVADIAAALGTLNLGTTAPWITAWLELQRTVWGFGLDSVRRELAQFEEAVPGAIGRDGLALVKAYAASSAERVFTDLSTRVQMEALTAFRSGVSTAGMQATVAQVFDTVIRGESQPPRLTTRMLSARALNEGRADAIARGGIPLAGAQFSAILDKRTCGLCERLDEQVIAIADTDFAKYTAPLHFNCRCVWVFITTGEADFTPTWSSPSKTLVDQYGGFVIGS
jgi:hypothetical protein